ncbi:WSC domain-containing protein [Colletotrichum spaethianum]|uniref:WSC domain-containing protein n=1 Tax=Colletotrichum spaethianum TaxID=700344 RepID=A0AA37P7L4_9PEZI|nr:WSC domain-containing protein [Colletotrichum spaethianum]GKT44524.1 WSC domain-containing protein [Colletotrichum spaethianum]
MHAYSALSLVSFTLVTIASAASSRPGAINPIAPENAATNATTKRSVELVGRGTSVQRDVQKRSTNGICDTLASPWTYMGCFTDTTSGRVLDGDSYHGDDMSQEKCIAYCDGKGYSMAGVEWGRECYCGYLLDTSADKSPETDCSKPCAGNSDEVCGNGGRINVFTNGDAAPAILAASGDFTSLGCYSDHASARTLTTSISLPGNVRVSDCTTACANQGFQYAGLEFGKECFCGSSIQNGGAPIAAKSCNMACTADKTQYCGGRAAINIYKSSKPQTGGPSVIPDNWVALGCYTDSPSSRSLSYKIPSFDKFSAAQCVSQCAGLGYQFAGLEYGSECFCGNTIDNGNSPASSGCDMSCAGNRFDTCGGAGRINIYQAACQGTRDCHFGYGLIDEIDITSDKQCSDHCHANPNCQSYQLGVDYGQYFCNIFSYAIPVVRANANDNRCLSFKFYDSKSNGNQWGEVRRVQGMNDTLRKLAVGCRRGDNGL